MSLGVSHASGVESALMSQSETLHRSGMGLIPGSGSSSVASSPVPSGKTFSIVSSVASLFNAQTAVREP
jgi:hypothetical protein